MSVSPDQQLNSNDSPSDGDATRDFVENPKIALILDEYLADLQKGTASSRQQFLDQHPEFAEELAEYLDGVEMVAGLGVGADLVPQQLGDFEIVESIGQGAMGVVYRANQISLKRPVALKVLRYAVTGKQATKRFEREAELVATLDHPHIVKVHAFGQHENLHYFAMQLIEGESLAQWSATEDPSEQAINRDPVKIARWCAEVARALAHAHQRDVVHRDVKPSNLLKDGDDKIWLTDFGLARRFDDVRMSMTGAMLGTPNYMSPEQASPSRHPIDHRTDIYSLGATLFELLTGRTVFIADTPHAVLAQVLVDEAPPLSELNPDVSRDLETIVMKCLEKEPHARYQTASDLADDLEAFTEGRSIKARRPSVIERFARWKRQHQAIVRWAAATTAMTVTILAVSIAALLALRNSSMGRLMIDSDQGPIVGRLISEDGSKTDSFTIPFQRAMSVAAGRYKLQMWAGGRVGQTQELFVERGQTCSIDASLHDVGVFPDRTVEGIPKRWSKPDGDAIVMLHENGVTLVDPQTGKDVWTANETDLTKPIDSANKQEEALQEIKPFEWRWHQNVSFFADRRIPTVGHGSLDANQDGERDLLIACHQQPVLLALDGSNGQRLWQYLSAPPLEDGESPSRFLNAGAFGKPRSVADLDGDGVDDIISMFCSDPRRDRRWMDAISGKTGQRIWRTVFPADWFAPGKLSVPDSCQTSFVGPNFRHRNTSGFSWEYRDGLGSRNHGRGTTVPWELMDVRGESNSDRPTKLLPDDSFYLVCGTRLISRNVADGKPNTNFNGGNPLELGFFPALQPEMVWGADGKLIGVLLCEQVSIAPNGAGAKPVTRFSMWSTETSQPLWEYDAECDPGWTGIKPDWPLVSDLNGDGNPEILIADGADLENEIYQGASRLFSLQAIDALSGKPIWNPAEVAELRNVHRQAQSLVMGPDADGDSLTDIYVVNPMLARAPAQGDVSSIFIEVVSGATGRKIRSVECSSPLPPRVTDLETPFFWGTAPDGSPQMVISSTNIPPGTSQRQCTIVVSTGTGSVTYLAEQLENPLVIDGAAASAEQPAKSLFLVKPRDRSEITKTGQLVSMRPQPQVTVNVVGDRYAGVGDIDGDGVRDLVNAAVGRQRTVRALSGRTGKQLWDFRFPTQTGTARTAGGDFDDDGVTEVLVWDSVFAGRLHQTTIRCLSGKTGVPMWTFPITTDVNGVRLSAVCEDLDGDGRPELILRFKELATGQTGAKLRLSCLDGRSGKESWSQELAPEGSKPTSHYYYPLDGWPIEFVDVDNDGTKEVCSVAIDKNEVRHFMVWENDGNLKWKAALADSVATFPLKTFLGRVIETKEQAKGQQPKIAVASSTKKNLSKWTVTMDWLDGDTGRRVSTWSARGRLREYPPFGSELPELSTGVPFAVHDGDRTLTGFYIENPRRDKMEIVVLDSSQPDAQVVQRVNIIHPENVGGGYQWSGKFLIADVNGNGQSELIHYDGADLVATTLVSDQEILRRPFKTSSRMLLKVDHARQLIHFKTTLEGDTRLNLVDLKTFQTKWSLRVPEESAKIISLQMEHATEDDPTPHVAFTSYDRGGNGLQRSQTRITAASDAQYVGSGPKSPSSLGKPSVSLTGLTRESDPRFVERLPWAMRQDLDRTLSIATSILFGMLAVCLGGVVFPFVFLKRMWNQRRWSLQTMLLLPLVFVVPFVALQLPALFEGSSELGFELAAACGLPIWLGLLISSLTILPEIVFTWCLIRNLWQGKWKKIGTLSAATVVISIVSGALMMAGHYREVAAGTRYQWWDWENVTLLVNGGWLMGLGVLGWHILIGAWRLLKRFGSWRRLAGSATVAQV